MSVKVYGYSDDLIEVEGDVTEEFQLLDLDLEDSMMDGAFLAFSSGQIIRIVFSHEGVWRITPVVGPIDVVQAPEDDDDNYTDVATIAGDVRWIVAGNQYAKSK